MHTFRTNAYYETGSEDGGIRLNDTQTASDVSLDALYRRHWAELCGYVVKTFGYGPPEPEDLAQAAFTRFAALSDPSEVKNPRAYLYRTVHNEAIAYRRRETTKTKHAQTVEDVYVPNKTDDRNGERVLLAKERVRIVERVVEAMSETKRNVLLLNRFEGLSKAEIARRLGISPTHVKRLLQQAVAECREAVERADARDQE